MQDNELRLAALAKLVTAKSEAVEQKLGQEMARIEHVLLNGTDFEELADALKTLAVLAPKFHGAVLPLLKRFVEVVPQRALTTDGELIDGARLRYRSPAHLIREAIDATNPVRYLHTEALVEFLLDLSQSTEEEVAGKARRAVEALAEFNLDLFYGQNGLGAQPQIDIVTHLGNLDDNTLARFGSVILSALRRVLSASMEGHTWTYNEVTISRGAIPSEWGVAPMRAQAIDLLKRMYAINPEVAYRKNVLSALDVALHRERATSNEAIAAMFERDALDILAFLVDLVATEPLPLVQAIEHQAYWNYYHAASPAIAAAALKVRDAVDGHAEYQIYKQLIGFEGIHGQWEDLRRSEAAWDYTDKKRRDSARQYVEEINDKNYELWRNRILKFGETRSDDLAMFPVFYEFLELLGQHRPTLAFELLTEHLEVMDPFEIALMAGLWVGPRSADIEAVALRWIAEGTHLIAIAKSLIKTGENRLDLLSAVIDKGAELDSHNVLAFAMGTAARLHSEGVAAAKAVFMRGLRELTKRDDANWARAVWFNRDFKTLIASMDVDERAEVLDSLASLKTLDYQSEEVLASVCEHDSGAVRNFLMNRLKEEANEHRRHREIGLRGFDENRFEAIPNHLHHLNKLLAKEPKALIDALIERFDDEARSMFQYRGGARLLKAVFPDFAAPLPGLLQELVVGANPKSVDFALSVLRAFGGSAPILDTVKTIVAVVPEHSSTWNELAAAIETTGTVWGEYGMAEAYERTRQKVAAWSTDEDPHVRAFAEWLTKGLGELIERERKWADDELELRKYRFGAGKGDIV